MGVRKQSIFPSCISTESKHEHVLLGICYLYKHYGLKTDISVVTIRGQIRSIQGVTMLLDSNRRNKMTYKGGMRNQNLLPYQVSW